MGFYPDFIDITQEEMESIEEDNSEWYWKLLYHINVVTDYMFLSDNELSCLGLTIPEGPMAKHISVVLET